VALLSDALVQEVADVLPTRANPLVDDVVDWKT